MNNGKLIVIEGGDGSGKGTQLQLLVQYCEEQKIPVASFDFPQYGKTFFGDFCGRFLAGEFGSVSEVSPYIISLPYAADRWQAKKSIQTSLDEGKLVVINRWAPSNAAYQAAKLPAEKRQAFINWSFQMEYEEFGIPREDMVVYLHVPVSVSQKLIDQKSTRDYLKNGEKKDIHERNIELLQTVESLYLQFVDTYPHWKKIECCEGETLSSKEEIHQKIITEVFV